MKYAARALDLVGPEHEELEAGFLERLSVIASNETPPRSGKTIFLEEAKPRVPAHLRVAAGVALWEAVAASGDASPKQAAEEEGQDGRGKSEPRRPGVPGFLVEAVSPNLFRVTHRRTLRQWQVETMIRRPSAGRGAVGVRLANGHDHFLPLEFSEIPEGFRFPIRERLTREIPDPGGAMITAVENLAETGAGGVGRVRDLADLHILLGLPIPFDAQTTFFKILKEAPAQLSRQIDNLREPLGFTPNP